jgi:hypothetical protein
MSCQGLSGLEHRVTKKGLAVEDSGCVAVYRAAKGLMEQPFQPTETGEKGLILGVPCFGVHPECPDRERKRG